MQGIYQYNSLDKNILSDCLLSKVEQDDLVFFVQKDME